MSYVTPDQAPGYYLEGVTVNFAFDPTVANVAFTVNGVPPALSKYIAYDTLTPPNPFLAVTQDGKGNVVYDGGFPKFYNNNGADPGATTFAQLNPANKFLYNALNFIANPAKVADGNRKILVMGDKTEDPYWIKSTATSSFYTTFQKVMQVGNWQATYKDASDWGGNINCTLAELEQYAGVIFMSTRSDGVAAITPSAVTDLVTYRANGSGIIFITDHGTDIASVEAAAVGNYSNTFFNAANKVMVNFGAWFSGNVDRTPVNVGFLRSTYGDHPLYNGLADTDSIYAGGSESRVFVTTYPQKAPAQFEPVVVTEPGNNSINILVELTDGRVETYRFIYVVATGDIVSFTTAGDVEITEVNIGLENRYQPRLLIRGSGLGTLTGVLKRGSQTVGQIQYTEADGTQLILDDAAGVIVNDNDRLIGEITSPFQYSSELLIRRFQPDLTGVQSLADVVAQLAPEISNPRRAVQELLTQVAQIKPHLGLVHRPDSAAVVKQLRDYFSNETP